MPFISFYGLIALVRTSSTISDKSCETDILSLFLDLRGKEYSLSTLCMLAAFWGCSLQLRNISCIPILRVFTMKNIWNFVKQFFFASVGMIMCFLKTLVTMVDYTD